MHTRRKRFKQKGKIREQVSAETEIGDYLAIKEFLA